MIVTDVLTKLVEGIIQEKAFFVSGPQERYRCKATYSLHPRFSPSVTVSRSVNAVCETVSNFVETESTFAKLFPTFFFEVMCKENRRGEFMVKIVFMNQMINQNKDGNDVQGDKKMSSFYTLWEEWRASDESANLVDFIRKRHSSVQLVVGHVDLKPPFSAGSNKWSKPSKKSHYIPLIPHSSGTLWERTANDKLYRLSPDSFCEVNHIMEEKIFHYICDVLGLQNDSQKESAEAYPPSSTVGSPSCSGSISTKFSNCSPKHLFLCGRDILAMFSSFESFYSSVHCVTSCPSVFEDSKRHPIPSCRLLEKNEVAEEFREFCKQNANETHHAIFTSGRYGLHPSTSLELVNNVRESQTLEDLIYISCNKASFVRDLHLLKEGFRVENVSVFDFFPQTSYEMIVAHWIPYSSIKLNGSLLVMPVGPPGSGKSVCGLMLKKMFSTTESLVVPLVSEDSTKEQFFKLNSRIQAKNSIPRNFLEIESSLSIFLVERDRLFKDCRERGLSLKVSRTETHSALLQSLRNPCQRKVVYLDSTNTNNEARMLYSSVWEEQCSNPALTSSIHSFPSLTTSSVLELHFTCRDLNELLIRVRKRVDHPSFPTLEEEQANKVETILDALYRNDHGTSKPVIDSSKYFIDNTLSEKRTIECIQYIVCAHLFFSPSIAHILCQAMKYSKP